MPKLKALLTGISGQTASYLAELLLEKDYEVHGLIRRTSTSNTSRIDHILNKITLHIGDMCDTTSIQRIIDKVRPDEIYNFAALSHVRLSYDAPVSTLDITLLGYARILETVKNLKLDCKIYQASSSEMFGKVQEIPQKETTPFYPRSPYGVAKAAAFFLGRAYREGYAMKIYNGILFNHSSSRRGDNFLEKKVVAAAVKIKLGLQDKLQLGNLDSVRDWGYAKEYAYWIYRIMQHPTPTDFVIGTGENFTVKEFVKRTFEAVGLDYTDYVVIDENLFRPAEVDTLQADYSKAETLLGYEPQTKVDELIRIMVEEEFKLYHTTNEFKKLNLVA